MKHFFTIVSMLLFGAVIGAQTPAKMSYQAVVRDAGNKLVANQSVGVRITILQGSVTGTEVYTETQTPATNSNGLMSIEIGDGTTFNTIDWSNGPYFIKTETDPDGGTNYSISGTSQLLSVPFAFYAKTSGGASFDPDVAFDDTQALTTKTWSSSKIQTELDGKIENTSETVTGDLMTYDGTNWVSKKLVMGYTGGGQVIDNRQPSLVLNYCIATNGIYPMRSSIEPFYGEIELFAFNFVPEYYAACNGQLMNIYENSVLFSLLGTQFGGNGSTTFALPDLRGRVVIGQGQGTGLSNYGMGQKFGSEAITVTINNLPSHTHVVSYE